MKNEKSNCLYFVSLLFNLGNWVEKKTKNIVLEHIQGPDLTYNKRECYYT